MSLKSRKEEQIDPTSMSDLLNWWESVEEDQKHVIVVDMRLAGMDAGKRLAVSVRAYKPSLDQVAVPVAEARLSWPTASHKNVLSLIWFLLRGVERQLEAGDALDSDFPSAAD